VNGQAEQRVVRFRGTVQGVGFRYTTCRIADRYAVTGTVRNCADGSVECVVEGSHKEITAFLAEVQSAMGDYVREMTQDTSPATNAFDGFRIIR
jgi:acylphosphatase